MHCCGAGMGAKRRMGTKSRLSVYSRAKSWEGRVVTSIKDTVGRLRHRLTIPSPEGSFYCVGVAEAAEIADLIERLAGALEPMAALADEIDSYAKTFSRHPGDVAQDREQEDAYQFGVAARAALKEPTP